MVLRKVNSVLILWALSCTPVFSQQNLLDRRITIRFEGHTVNEALKKLAKEANCTINFNFSELPQRRSITKGFTQKSIETVIKEIWGSDQLNFMATERKITIQVVPQKELKSEKGHLKGTITDENNDPLPGVTVRLLGTSTGNITDKDGHVNLEGIPPGDRTIEASFVGYESAIIQVKVHPGGIAFFSKQLKPATNMLHEVVVEGNSLVRELALDPIKINTIDAKAFQIQSVGAAEMLRTAPGVLVRRTGGLGSAASVNLNGLSGNAVRIYIDGFPVEYLGGGYNLNNLPGSVIDRLEVYKGVVPADKGTDALGGAVNIVSRRLYDDELELSYQVGSFNTHRASVLGSKQINDHFAVTLEGYHNYSDNNFKLANIRNISVDSIPNRFGGNLIPSIRIDTLDKIRRFHDAHRSSFVQAGLNWNDLSWADQLSMISNFSKRFDEVQTLDVTLGSALLGRTAETTAFNQSLAYIKRFFDEKLEVKYRGVISNSVQASKNDNINRINWKKEVIPAPRPLMPLDVELEGFNHAHRLGLAYNINDQHKLSANNFYARSRFFRKNNLNPLFSVNGELVNRNELPSFFTKNISSIEWRGDWLNKKLTSILFGKHYFYRAETVVIFQDKLLTEEVQDEITGYGGALKYLFTDHFFIRGSYEFAVRIPTEREVYGDFENVRSNFNLRPERSDNFNMGITYEKEFDEFFTINTSLDGFVRDTKDLIWLRPDGGGFLQFRNNRQVRSMGMEWSLKITRDDYSNIEYNLTRQERTYQGFNLEESSRQDPAFIGTRFPNTPSFFYNLQLNLGIKSIKSTLPNLVLYGSWFHVKSFSISDEPADGEPEPFSFVPVQNEFNLGLGYFSSDDKLSLSFQVNNLTNDFELFDNWRIPKPNRNFQFKVNYQIF
ncbi:MAG: TonB-dependent receptor [Bacteroidota bacterium]